MPALPETIGGLVAARLSCVLSCSICNVRTKISPLEAIASYGGLMRFSEVSSAIRARCTKKSTAGCQFRIEPTPSPFTQVDRGKQDVEGNATTKTPK